MHKPETISPAVKFQFEQFISDICDEGKVDPEERPKTIREWTGYLGEQFRKIVAAGRTTDEEAARKVIEQFGPARSVIKSRRGGLRGLWHRLLYYSNYSTHRSIAPVAFCLFHAETTFWQQDTVSGLSYKSFGIAILSWHYYVPIIILLAMVLARAAVRKFPEVKHLIRIVALGLVFFIFANIAYNWASSIQYLFGPWSAQPPSADDYPRWLDYFAGSVISGEYLSLIHI